LDVLAPPIAGSRASEEDGGKRRIMTEVSMKEMLEAGVHFGHKTDKWNPKMAPFIFTQRNGVHIFDLAKTKACLETAGKAVAKVAGEGGEILFVGTKNQTKDVVRDAADACGMPYLVDRWPGGMLTNFHTILGRLKYMKDAEEKTQSGKGLTKKETLNLSRELEKLNTVFEGVKELRKVPEAIFIADIVKEKTAVREAKRLSIPIIGIADTNAIPDIEYVIPGNDDAVRSVKYIADYLSMVIVANKKATAEAKEVAEKKEEKKDAKEDEEPKETGKDEAVEKIEKLEMTAEEKAVVKKQKPKEEEKGE
jgi:small subunit ribosomal protein S2